MTDLLPASAPLAVESFIDEWERQPGEPRRAFSAFVLFRDMGDERGVVKVRTDAGFAATPKTLMAWATTWRWVERADAFDRMLDRKRVAEHVAEVEAMARRQVHIGQVLQERGLEYVKDELDTTESRAKNMSANTALRFIDTGVNLEREGLGMDDKGGTGDTNITVNVLEAGAKADVFSKIDEMAANFASMKEIIARGGAPEPTDIIDAEVVEDLPSP